MKIAVTCVDKAYDRLQSVAETASSFMDAPVIASDFDD